MALYNKKIINSTGFSLSEVMISILILSLSTAATMRFFSNSQKAQLNLEQLQTKSNLHQDIFSTLSDERNCLATFKNIVFKDSSDPKNRYIKSQAISEITNSVGSVLFKVNQEKLTHRSVNIKSLILKNNVRYPNEDFKAHGELHISAESRFKKSSNANSLDFFRKINLTFILDQDPSNLYKVQRCWSSGGMVADSSLFPACEDGEVLIYQNKKPVCSKEIGSILVNTLVEPLPCHSVTISGFGTNLGKKCATLVDTKKNEFWVNKSNLSLNSSDGLVLYDKKYTTLGNNKLFIDLVVNVLHDYENPSGPRTSNLRYESPFLAAIWVKPTDNSTSYKLAGYSNLYNPFSKPAARLDYKKNGVGNTFNLSFHPDASAGSTGYISGVTDVIANKEYHIKVNVFSISGFHGLTVDNMPKLSFGTIRHDDYFAQGMFKLREVTK